jgi:voltage-gated potassium channel
MSDSIKRVIIAVLILLGILLVGTAGFSYFEDWSFFDSIWMTVITMSTVGFNEVHPLHTESRILAMFIIGCTLLVGGYAIGNISAFLIEGEMGELLKGRKMERKIGRLKKHVILIGFGLVVHEAAKAWDRENLVVIEKFEDRYENAVDHGFKAIHGDATHDDILEKPESKQLRVLCSQPAWWLRQY